LGLRGEGGGGEEDEEEDKDLLKWLILSMIRHAEEGG
jgi:hypothetical protein